MKIKINENHHAEWTFMNCPSSLNLYEGKLITYRESKRFGYRYDIILLNDIYYITQSLLNPRNNTESISVHPVKSVNDAKAIIEAMIQMNKTYHKPKPVVEVDA